MANATIIRVWKDGSQAHMAARVPEGGPLGNVEYLASTSLKKEDGVDKTNSELKEDLRLAMADKRNIQLATVQNVAITGTVVI